MLEKTEIKTVKSLNKGNFDKSMCKELETALLAYNKQLGINTVRDMCRKVELINNIYIYQSSY